MSNGTRPPQLRIALVNDLLYPFFKGGVEKRVYDIGRRLAAEGHDVHLVGSKAWDGPRETTQEGMTLHGVRSSTKMHNGTGRRSIWQALVCAIGVAARLARMRVDVIDVQSMAPLSCLLALTVARLKRIPTVVTWHEVWGDYWQKYLGRLGLIGQMVERAMARLGHAHIAVSEETLARVVGLRARDPILIPNGIDLARVAAIDEAGDGPDVICVSRLVKHKNIPLLLDAIARMASPESVELAIVGDGPERAALERYAASLGLGGVRFRTDVDSEEELFALLKASSVFVLPSLREGFGLAVLEAATCGLPAIVIDHADNAANELAHPDLVLMEEPAILGAVIGNLLNDPGQWAKYSTASQEMAASHDLGWIVNRLVVQYRDVIHAGRAATDMSRQHATSARA
ncbi:MAG: glycosyltransferase family 4 protein [Acidimicrobiia bacterium]